LHSAATVCLSVLQRVWSDPALKEKFAVPPSAEPDDAKRIVVETQPKPLSNIDKKVRTWLALAQDLVALEVTVYLSQFFVHLRNLILFLTIAPLLMLLAVSSYPFQPQRLWLLLAGALVGIGTATVVWIIIQIERNEVVSHILSTTPNRLNFHWHFLGQIL